MISRVASLVSAGPSGDRLISPFLAKVWVSKNAKVSMVVNGGSDKRSVWGTNISYIFPIK